MGIRFVRRIASYNALFDTEKSVIAGKIALFWDENCFKLMGWLGPTPILTETAKPLTTKTSAHF